MMKRTGTAKQAEERPSLTPRQQEVLELVTDGYTSREIADQLKISVQTVEVHRFNLMRRLNVKNVAQLIRRALVWRYLPMAYVQGTVSKARS